MRQGEKFFIPEPVLKGKSPLELFDVYATDEGEELKWSGGKDLPKIGARVFVKMNGIGWVEVRGYFRAEDYVGVMGLPDKAPQWLVEQKKQRKDAPAWMKKGIGCYFGAEIDFNQSEVQA